MKVVILGGAGFLGTNLCLALARRGDDVLAVDDLSRAGSENNAPVLTEAGVRFEIEDIARSLETLEPCDVLVNLAAQATVTESVRDPREDFRRNVLGHLNVLEWCRMQGQQPAVLFASTNKVYGEVLSIPVDESHPMDFQSPYGCSKGAADSYTRDYARTYGMRTLVLRQSCIYGEFQWGIEGQGWLSWFAQRIIAGEPLTIYGDGHQVRDVLHVDDWVDCVIRAIDTRDSWDGQAVNVGGGAWNSLSLVAAVQKIGFIAGCSPIVRFGPVRTADQPEYISDISLAMSLWGWEPFIGLEDGINRLVEWTRQSTSTPKSA
jgi:CDP-paratose 2-epimerase